MSKKDRDSSVFLLRDPGQLFVGSFVVVGVARVFRG